MVIYILVLLTFLAAGGTSVSRTDHLHVMMFCFMVKRIVGGGVEVISFGLFHSTLSLPLVATASSVGCRWLSTCCGEFCVLQQFRHSLDSDGSIIWVDRQQPLLLMLLSIKPTEDSPCYMNHCYESNQASLTSYFFTLSFLLMTYIFRLIKFVVLIVTMSVMVRMTFVN